MKDGEHLGPMAQDFYAAFGLGGSDRTITLNDEAGVALAAIKGLSDRVESENALLRQQLNRPDAENTELRERLERLEKVVLKQVSN
jgi:hypothetical protein